VTTAELFLPWPDRKMSPNARIHWGKLARARKKAKRDAYYAAKEAGLGKISADTLSVRYVVYPPDRRARDQDNIIASLKAYADGIAEAIGIDDSKWNISISPRGPIEKGGMIKVELDWSAA
jgi:crossover junction endodeoxyribonuclease RusA